MRATNAEQIQLEPESGPRAAQRMGDHFGEIVWKLG